MPQQKRGKPSMKINLIRFKRPEVLLPKPGIESAMRNKFRENGDFCISWAKGKPSSEFILKQENGKWEMGPCKRLRLDEENVQGSLTLFLDSSNIIKPNEKNLENLRAILSSPRYNLLTLTTDDEENRIFELVRNGNQNEKKLGLFFILEIAKERNNYKDIIESEYPLLNFDIKRSIKTSAEQKIKFIERILSEKDRKLSIEVLACFKNASDDYNQGKYMRSIDEIKQAMELQKFKNLKENVDYTKGFGDTELFDELKKEHETMKMAFKNEIMKTIMPLLFGDYDSLHDALKELLIYNWREKGELISKCLLDGKHFAYAKLARIDEELAELILRKKVSKAQNNQKAKEFVIDILPYIDYNRISENDAKLAENVLRIAVKGAYNSNKKAVNFVWDTLQSASYEELERKDPKFANLIQKVAVEGAIKKQEGAKKFISNNLSSILGLLTAPDLAPSIKIGLALREIFGEEGDFMFDSLFSGKISPYLKLEKTNPELASVVLKEIILGAIKKKGKTRQFLFDLFPYLNYKKLSEMDKGLARFVLKLVITGLKNNHENSMKFINANRYEMLNLLVGNDFFIAVQVRETMEYSFEGETVNLIFNTLFLGNCDSYIELEKIDAELALLVIGVAVVGALDGSHSAEGLLTDLVVQAEYLPPGKKGYSELINEIFHDIRSKDPKNQMLRDKLISLRNDINLEAGFYS
ncbi:hypothetical protein KAW38_04920 [Candidatus Micrarchaeota archaeon]|nr:hypothetical protein [Candidatus Micrarchaeota archaeon]